MNNRKSGKAFTYAVLYFLAAWLALAGGAFAQTTLVTLEGSVKDSGGEALAGAVVNVKNVETGYTYNALVRTDGRYRISGIQPGKHEMEVSLQGFDTQKRLGLTFYVGAKLTIDFVLVPTSLKKEVVVTAEAPMVEVTRSEISNVVDRKKIDELPILLSDKTFEGWSYLSITTAGIQTDGSDQVGNAMPRGSGEILMDGVSVERIATGRATIGIPSEAIQEFRVITNQFQAEYGNAGDLVRTAVTRSGTNEFRGRLSYFYRNEAFSDVNYFIKYSKYQGDEIANWTKPTFQYHRYGGFVGGPIKKDKTHFIVVYDGMRLTNYNVITSPLVPREAVQYIEKPNRIMVKVNHQLNEKNIFSFRYNLDYPVRLNMGVGGLNTRDRILDYYRTVHDFFGSWTLFPSGNSMNELRLQFLRQVDDQRIPAPDSYSISRPSGNFGKSPNQPQGSKFRRFQVNDNFNLFLDKHSLKAGFDLSVAPWFFYNPQNIPGTFVFNTDKPFDASDASTYPYSFTYAVGNPGVDIDYTEFALFVQDSWKVSSQLTLNLGLRYNMYFYHNVETAKWDLRNLNPRLGFSWDPFGDGKTSVRGGVGTYSTNIAGDALTNIAFNDTLATYRIMFPNYPDPFAVNPFYTPVPGSVSKAMYDSKKGLIAPYSLQVSLGIERQILEDISASTDLIWTKGYRLPFFIQNNPIIPGTSVTRIDPSMGDYYTLSDIGKSEYKGLYLTVRKRFSRGWGFDVAYTLSKSEADVDYVTSTPANYEDPENKRMYGPTNMDARHVLSLSGLFDLPFGFQLGTLFYYNSARPWTPIYNGDANKDGLVSDYVDAFRNSRRGFSSYFLNMRLTKSFKIGRWGVQVLAEGFNITNNENFGGIYSRLGNALFGLPTSAGDPRQFQVGIRIDY